MDNLMLVAVLSMAGLAILFAGVLAFADKKLKVEEHPLVDKINHMLPGVNCGACGCLSCHDFAEKVALQGDDPGKCRVASEEVREKLYKMAGKEEGARYPQIALVHCSAETEKKEPIADYNGVETCRGANLVFGGGMQCQYGCMGLGDCVDACPFDAIKIENGLAKVDAEKCTGCGKCVESCPRNIISVQEKKWAKLFYVACSSHDNALRVRNVCGVGCIGCGICVKLSQEGFFRMEDNLSIAEYTKQDRPEEIEKLQEKCPPKVIKDI